MSADVLRRAASLMRERSEAATEGPWMWAPWDLHPTQRRVTIGVFNAAETLVADLRPEGERAGAVEDAEHIASWHPAVALAVADWLDSEAAKQTPTTHLAVTFDGAPMFPIDPQALAVARAYLGEETE